MHIAAALAGFRMGLVSTGWTISQLASTKTNTVGSFQSGRVFVGQKAPFLLAQNYLQNGLH